MAWGSRLKPWDVCAGVLIVEEAGGRVTTMDGQPYSVFDRSLLASNTNLQSKVGKAKRSASRECVLGSLLMLVDRTLPVSMRATMDLMLFCAAQVLEKTAAATDGLRESGVDLSRWFVPEGYVIQS